MKLSLLQCDVRDGDLLANAKNILNMAREAQKSGAELCFAPVAAICGPQAEIYCRQPDFRAALDKVCHWLAGELATGPALCCGTSSDPNNVCLFSEGKIEQITDSFAWKGHVFALRNSISAQNVILLSLEPRQFYPGSQKEFETLLADMARNQKAWFIAPNLAGGYGAKIYNGQSIAVSPAGEICARGVSFQQQIVNLDMQSCTGDLAATCASSEEAQWQALVIGLADFVRKSGGERVIVGLSGGMDSALVACIAVEALGPDNVIGVLMPSPYSSEGSVTDALALAHNLGIETVKLPIADIMQGFSATLQDALAKFPAGENDLTFENLQARIRGTLLMALANRLNALVLNTGNKSESAMGYCTLYGDTAGALAVIGDLFKTRVYELAAWFCKSRGRMIIPQNIFDKAPSAELRPGQKDTDSLPPYEKLDPMLAELISSKMDNMDGEMAEIARKAFTFQFKRQQCPMALLVDKYHLDVLAAPLAGTFNTTV